MQTPTTSKRSLGRGILVLPAATLLLASTACFSWEQSVAFLSRPDIEMVRRDLLREELYIDPDAPDWRDRDAQRRADHAWATLLAELRPERREAGSEARLPARVAGGVPAADPMRFAGVGARVRLAPVSDQPAAPAR